ALLWEARGALEVAIHDRPRANASRGHASERSRGGARRTPRLADTPERLAPLPSIRWAVKWARRVLGGRPGGSRTASRPPAIYQRALASPGPPGPASGGGLSRRRRAGYRGLCRATGGRRAAGKPVPDCRRLEKRDGRVSPG